MIIKKRDLLIVGILVLISSFFVVTGDVPTHLEVPDSPPAIIEEIPNQTWAANTSLENAFKLDDYFFHPNGYPIIGYYHSDTENINIVIDENSSDVSFYPDPEFIGTETVKFFASDGENNGTSNLVYLNVGTDTEPPKWSSPLKDKDEIYQSDYVTFYTTWTDNVRLGHYIFSINHGDGWENHSKNFEGLREEIAEKRIQIRAPANTNVQWKFYGFDSSGNMNVTDIFSFNVSERDVVDPEPPERVRPEPEELEPEEPEVIRSINIEPEYFQFSILQGERTTRVLEITNTGNTELDFSLSLQNMQEFAIISDESFELDPRESKRVTIDFEIRETQDPQQYFGTVIVDTYERFEIPIILDVNEFEQVFGIDVDLIEAFLRRKPGDEVEATITIENLKDIRETEAELYIAIKDLSGNIYDYDEDIVVFTDSKEIDKKLVVPQDVDEGRYIFYGRIFDGNNTALDSEIFEVGYRFDFAAIFRTGGIFISIILLGLFLAFLMVKYRRQKEKEKLLSLYMLVNEMKSLIEENKYDEALKIYLRVKRKYGEKVPEDIKENREKLVEKIKELSKNLGSKGPIKQEESSKKDKESEEEGESEEKEKSEKEESSKKDEEGDKEEKSSEEKEESKKEVKSSEDKGKPPKKENKPDKKKTSKNKKKKSKSKKKTSSKKGNKKKRKGYKNTKK